MKLRSNAAGGGLSRFAHLAGLARRTRASEEEKREEETAEEEEEETPEEEKDTSKGKGKKAGEEEREEETAEEEEEEEDEKPEASAAFQRGHKAGAAAERARAGAIFAAPEAATNPGLAAHLAFETGVSAKAAIGILQASGGQPQGGKAGLGARMAGVRPMHLGRGDAPAADTSTPQGLAAFALRAAGRAK